MFLHNELPWIYLHIHAYHLHHNLMWASPEKFFSLVWGQIIFKIWTHLSLSLYPTTEETSAIVYGAVHLVFILALSESSAILFFKPSHPLQRDC